MCGPHQVWPLRSECWGRGVPTKVVCAECMKMCCLGGKNSVVKGLTLSNVQAKLPQLTFVLFVQIQQLAEYLPNPVWYAFQISAISSASGVLGHLLACI